MALITIVCILYLILYFSVLCSFYSSENKSINHAGLIFLKLTTIMFFVLFGAGIYAKYEKPVITQSYNLKPLYDNTYISGDSYSTSIYQCTYWNETKNCRETISNSDHKIEIIESSKTPHLEIQCKKKIHSYFYGFLSNDIYIYKFYVPKNTVSKKIPSKAIKEEKVIDVNVTEVRIRKYAYNILKPKYFITFTYNNKSYTMQVSKDILYYYYNTKNVKEVQETKFWCTMRGNKIIELCKEF